MKYQIMIHSLPIQIGLTNQFKKATMETKFSINNATKANVKHTKQPDSTSCSVMICYYADQIINGNALFELL